MTLLGIAAPAGLATGLAAWLLAGGLSVRAEALEATHARLQRLRPPPMSAGIGQGASATALLATPLFALTTGPGAVREPSIRIDGLAVTRRRTAALVSIDNKPPEWLQVGESRDGVTVQAVTSAGATFETALGVKSLNLGEQSAASSPAPGGSPPGAQATLDAPPPGFRSPPEPASAPRSP